MFLPDNSVFVPVTDPNLSPERTPSAAPAHGSSACPPSRRWSSPIPRRRPKPRPDAAFKCPTHWCTKKCPAGVPVTEFIGQGAGEGL